MVGISHFYTKPLRITPKPLGSKSKTIWIQVQNLKDLLPPPPRLRVTFRLIFFVLFSKCNLMIIDNLLLIYLQKFF